MRAIIAPCVQGLTGIQVTNVVNIVGLVDLGRAAGTTTELPESLTMTSPEIVEVKRYAYM